MNDVLFCLPPSTEAPLQIALLVGWQRSAVLLERSQQAGHKERNSFTVQRDKFTTQSDAKRKCWRWCADVNNGYRTPDFNGHLTGYDYELYCADNPITKVFAALDLTPSSRISLRVMLLFVFSFYAGRLCIYWRTLRGAQSGVWLVFFKYPFRAETFSNITRPQCAFLYELTRKWQSNLHLFGTGALDAPKLLWVAANGWSYSN